MIPLLLYFTAFDSRQSMFSMNQCLSVMMSLQSVDGMRLTSIDTVFFKCLYRQRTEVMVIERIRRSSVSIMSDDASVLRYFSAHIL
jgi:hypothetical protein